ncbi:MAG: hypothetical protein COT39_03075 [Parcubacteria group bacterium CG08_land_8_20_14_0_20_48_21]|nr:MAG: hypothetical protein COT39_03075 [Parcubacteria group bacterium CG08_land_8_20_14_0_20_48_21]PIW79619.1 MAG: hypothetical protein COZ99_00060 [Parcubacteria group bacterium CG_4_8_14_3_um_filter_48_16]PIY78277.1 MAG: hypothetical protein COY83_00755 [Parcubacteria group bacterium CG_4_10_14_0_8_um_filter_48_154]PIZ77382.1 MAG: hypothetical protein COY03_03075 [bacterium CG_4_10_14_0_2_um_filter_48_144]PJC39637.1 MAG: hypothetical protein CO043_03150 [Parcubacteria group bacterium CG_4_9
MCMLVVLRLSDRNFGVVENLHFVLKSVLWYSKKHTTHTTINFFGRDFSCHRNVLSGYSYALPHMSLLSSRASYLGVDIGNASIKVVELKNQDGRPQLVTYGFSETPVADAKLGTDSKAIDRLSELLSEVCSRARITTTKVIISLPTFSVFSSVITLPKMSKKELESAVHWEAKKVIPLPLEEMNLVWELINLQPGGGHAQAGRRGFFKSRKAGASDAKDSITPKEKYQEILLTGAPKTLVKRYIDICQKAGLDLLSLETEIFALARSLVGSDPETTMIVDIGAVTTNISIVVKGIPFLNRSIEIGGSTITRAIANSLNISLDRAEQFKRDVGVAAAIPGSVNSFPKTIETVINPILQEIQYSLNLFQSQYEQRYHGSATSEAYFARVIVDGARNNTKSSQKVVAADTAHTKRKSSVDRIVLTGGGSYLINLESYIADRTNLRVSIGDPWARVIYPEDLKPILHEIGAKFAISVGLAMRDIV